MSARHRTRPAKVLKVHWPISQGTMGRLVAGEIPLEPGGDLEAVFILVNEHEALGDFGIYRSVLEIVAGWELFTPGASSKPSFGEVGSNATSPTAIITIYIPADIPTDLISAAIDAIVEAHPWEVPVIESYETELIVRS